MFMDEELIGEFRGKNTAYRVLPDGKVEVMGQGAGKFVGTDSFMMSTGTGTMTNGVFLGEVNLLITTKDGDAVMMKGNTVGYPSGNGGLTRSASVSMTQSPKLMRLNKTICLSEFETDMTDNWTGKIWEWK
jgi:hypothetical protein